MGGRVYLPENFQQGSSYLQPIEMKYVSSIPAYHHHISESEGLKNTKRRWYAYTHIHILVQVWKRESSPKIRLEISR